MKGLSNFIAQVTHIVGAVFKYRFFVFIIIFITISNIYKVKRKRLDIENNKDAKAVFLEFQSKTNIFRIIARNKEVLFAIDDAILPQIDSDEDCQNKLAVITQNFIYNHVLSETDLKVNINSIRNNIYRGKMIIKEGSLGNILINLSLAYPENYKVDQTEWCNLLSIQKQ